VRPEVLREHEEKITARFFTPHEVTERLAEIHQKLHAATDTIEVHSHRFLPPIADDVGNVAVAEAKKPTKRKKLPETKCIVP